MICELPKTFLYWRAHARFVTEGKFVFKRVATLFRFVKKHFDLELFVAILGLTL